MPGTTGAPEPTRVGMAAPAAPTRENDVRARRIDASIVWLYIAAVTLFVAHSIDSTRFAEWTMFRMSPTSYIVAYIPLTAIALYGVVALERRLLAGYVIALLFGAIDAVAIVVHSSQLFGATEAFHAPVSVALIAAMLPVGLLLAALALWRIVEVRRARASLALA